MDAMQTPIVDAHHHLWRKADLPWLSGPMVPRIFGEYEAIRRDYLIDEFRQDMAACGVVKSVYVQTNWPEAGALDEVAWVQSIANQHHFPHAIVGYANLADPQVGRLLDAQMAHPGFRGVRQQLHWHANPLYRFAPAPDAFMDPQWLRGLAQVQERGLIFELQVFPGQMADAVKLVRQFPRLTFVLLHAGMLVDFSPESLSAWRTGLQALADCPHVCTKLSALSTFARRCDLDIWQPTVHETLSMFGPERCMFGSNFPVEKLWTSYAHLVDVMHQCLRDYPVSTQQAVWHDTASRVYRLG
jgi:predicted TIM-barrel fold metal-dependent hydrolase